MREQALTLLGGWARVHLPKPMSIGVLRPSVSAMTLEALKTPRAKHIEAIVKHPPDRVAYCIRSLYREYVKKVTSNQVERMMWICLDYGHEIRQIVREDHIAYTYGLLVSEDRTKEKMAEEAMQRTLGIYEIR